MDVLLGFRGDTGKYPLLAIPGAADHLRNLKNIQSNQCCFKVTFPGANF